TCLRLSPRAPSGLIALVALAGCLGAGTCKPLNFHIRRATTPFKILMATLFAFAGQQSLWLWSAWHRIHHKFSDTDRDPHNSRRGFFYSHMGWILTYDHKTFLENLGQIDISDLESDPVVMFHKKYYGPLHMILRLTCGEIINLMTVQLDLWTTSGLLI
ncbi:unnamed protein product, partial [Allacma fusca]